MKLTRIGKYAKIHHDGKILNPPYINLSNLLRQENPKIYTPNPSKLEPNLLNTSNHEFENSKYDLNQLKI